MILEIHNPQPPAPSPGEPWFALHVQPQSEFRVRQRLESRGIEYYLPATTRTGWRGLELERPVFPGYVFGRKSPEEIYAACRPNRWIIKICGDYLGPIEIPPVQIESLKIALAQPNAEVMADLWKGGEEVEVSTGPLAGCTGTVAWVKNKARLVVNVTMLGRAVSAELDAAAVKALCFKRAA